MLRDAQQPSWLTPGFNSCVTVAMRCGRRPHLHEASYICHDIVINPTDEVRPWVGIGCQGGARMAGKMLSVEPTIDPSAKLHEVKLGAYCEVGARTMLHEAAMGDYSYVVNHAKITYT